MKIPEIEVYKLIKGIVNSLKKDVSTSYDNSFVKRHFGDAYIGNYVFAKEVESIFLRPETVDNFLDVRLFFDAKRANLPTIHVTLPYEKGGVKVDGVGTDQGFEDGNSTLDGEYKVFTRGFSTSYSIIVSSSNTLETISIYRVLKAALIQYFDVMEVMGFQNVKISGGDLQLNPDIVPNGVFLRVITLDFDYQMSVEKILPDNYLKHLFANGNDVNY